MVAGRQLDALIAEKVMGIVPKTEHVELTSRNEGWFRADTNGKIMHDDPKLSVSNVRRYSTDIAAAWAVVNSLLEKHWNITLNCHHGKWSVLIDHATHGEEVEGDTAPLAICLAALKACK